MSAALPFSPSGRIHDLIARPTFPPKVTVSDDTGRPLSRRSRGASEVRRSPAAGMPFLGVSSLDLAAPVPAGAALLLGHLFYQHSRLRRQAQSGRALVYAFLIFLSHQSNPSSSQIFSHGGLTECGQNLGAVA